MPKYFREKKGDRRIAFADGIERCQPNSPFEDVVVLSFEDWRNLTIELMPVFGLLDPGSTIQDIVRRVERDNT